MHRFDYQFLADSLPANLLEIAGIIYDLRGKGEIRKMNNLHLFRELQHTAMVDSIQSSNAIEGIVTTAERVKKLVNKQSEPFTHDEQEILGYRDALDEIYHHHEDLEITGDLLNIFISSCWERLRRTPENTNSKTTGSRKEMSREGSVSVLYR